MKIGIHKFILFLLTLLVSVIIAIFTYLHFKQQEKTASVILNFVKSELTEVSYIVAKELKSKSALPSFRPLLDRISAKNPYVSVIVIHNGQNILLSTDPFFKKIPSTHQLENIAYSKYSELLNKEVIENKMRFYEGNKVQNLYVMFVLDQNEINVLFEEETSNFVIYFIVIPLLLILALWSIGQKFVIRPLELLRQFAYYQQNVPKAFLLSELEVIRYSMVETFNRLENEKKELYAVARTDSLSGLANRNALMEYLERLIASSVREEKEFAMLFLDLDHFKSVNDELGHNVGDELLKSVASKIDGVLRPLDFVARVGGDEFVIILQEYNSLLELTNVVDRIQETLEETWIIQTNPIQISSSIGIALFPKDGNDIVSLMKNSDISMYEAKKNGRSGYSFFTKELNERVQDTLKLERAMKDALVSDEYELFYQPKVNIATGKIISAEALIRWNSSDKGMIMPDVFIPLAEENGFIVSLGDWISKQAVQQQMLFKQKGIDIKISINLSPKQLLLENFAKDFIHFMDEAGVNPNFIDIEITENLFLQHNDKNIEVLNTLHESGLSISLDDFGTGYSSLSYLKDFPIDYIKIDKSFMDNFHTDSGRIFIDTIVKMGQTLNLKIIAEGVETLEQLEYLENLHCDQYQGYFFSKPLNTKDFEKLYLQNK